MYPLSLFSGSAIIIIGFIVATIGWKVHSFMIVIAGFVIGMIVCNLAIVSFFPFIDFMWIWGLSIFTGVFTAILFMIYEKTSIGVTSGLIGAAIISDLTSTRTLIGWETGYPLLETRLNYLPILITLIISSYAGLRFYKIGYIILSSGIGAILIAWGGTIAGLWPLDRVGFPILLSIFLGTIIQLAQEGKKRDLLIEKHGMKYCSKCSQSYTKEYLVCPTCGTLLVQSERE